MSGASAPFDPDIVLAAGAAREAERRRRARAAVGVSVAVTLVWVIYVSLSGHWPRVGENWAAALTMVFGSFVGGATPQGGGAIAFPVFTKGLGVPSDVARTFSLCIQTIGMGTASLAILINRRVVEWRAVIVGGSAALLSFVVALFAVGDPSRPFWPSTLPGDYVRVTFTLVLVGMAFVVYLGTRVRIRKVDTTLPPMNARLYIALVVAGLVGGLASALTGSGADVMIYLFIVVLFGVDPKVGVPSAVLVMSSVSVVGLVILGVADGQLAVELSGGSTGDVVAVGGQTVSGSGAGAALAPRYGAAGAALPAQRFDLFGMWIAALPVVAWGGPLGSWLASRLRARHLVYFALSLAVAETLSTVIFLDGLHRPGGLLAYAATGLVVLMAGLYFLAKYRRAIFGLPGLTLGESLSRGSLDVAAGYERELEDER